MTVHRWFGPAKVGGTYRSFPPKRGQPPQYNASHALVEFGYADKKNGQLSSLNVRGQGELLGNGGRGYYDMTAGGKWYFTGSTCKITRACLFPGFAARTE